MPFFNIVLQTSFFWTPFLELFVNIVYFLCIFLLDHFCFEIEGDLQNLIKRLTEKHVLVVFIQICI